MKILAIVGSPRTRGNTNYLVDSALEEAALLGVETEKVVLSELEIKPCVGHDNCSTFKKCSQNDDMNLLLEKFLDADGIILATPVYWYNVTAQMKTFIDRNYFAYMHDMKYKASVAGIIVVAEKEAIEDTLHTLNQVVDWCFALKQGGKFIVSGYAHTEGEVKEKTDIIEQARQLGRNMAKSLKITP